MPARILAGSYGGFALALVLTHYVDIGALVPVIPLALVCALLSIACAWWSA